MSLYARLAVVAVLSALLIGSHWKAYRTGGDRVQAAWQREKLQAEQDAETVRISRQTEVNQVGQEFAVSDQKAQVITRTIIKEVEKYVPVTAPLLPGGLRLFHDAAATGQEIDDSGGADAAPVTLKDVAVTVAENYSDANREKLRIAKLQEIIMASGCFDLPGE